MESREAEIEAALRRCVERLGGLCLKWTCPGHSGVPDRIVLLPGGLVYFVELKRPSGRLRPLQKWWRDRLLGLGFHWSAVYDLEMAAELEAALRRQMAREEVIRR